MTYENCKIWFYFGSKLIFENSNLETHYFTILVSKIECGTLPSNYQDNIPVFYCFRIGFFFFFELLFRHWREILMLFGNISHAKLRLVYFTAQMHWNWIVIQTRTNFREIFSIFTKGLPNFTSKLANWFWFLKKVQIKIVNTIICGQKNKCPHATGNKLSFFF